MYHDGIMKEYIKPLQDIVGASNDGYDVREEVNKVNNRVDEVSSQLAHIEKNNIKTPQQYGAKGNGEYDDSLALQNAMVDCANNGYVLFLNGKYKVSTNIVYNGWKPLTIIGTCGNYPSLTDDDVTQANESYDIYLDGATIEINKMGSVTFQSVGFASNSKTTGTGILLKSFHNKFINCAFSQMEKAIHLMKGNNWVGENQVLYCQFVKCTYGIYADEGVTSDSEVIGNVWDSSNDYAFYGSCAGFTFSLNHFYNKKSNYFVFFNTRITNNYIQESPIDEPSLLLDGSFGCLIGSNQFELISPDPRANKKALIAIKTRNGGGNITIDGNAVHGKNISPVENLSFIEMLPASNGTKYDMPIHYGNNNIRCCSALLKTSYPMYNLKGSLSLQTMEVIKMGGNIESQNTTVVNGICYFHVIMDSIPNYADMLKLQYKHSTPTTYTMKQTLKTGETQVVNGFTTNGTISCSNYSQISRLEVFGSYVIAHSTEPNYILL